MDKKKTVTIREIANEVGVSKTTISRFLNKSGYVDVDTANKIEAVINKFEYKPSITAQSLKTKKSRTILLVVPDICNPFYSTIVRIVQSIAKDRGYMIMLYNTNENILEEMEAVKSAADINAAGFVLWSIQLKSEIIAEMNKNNIPAVLANSYDGCPFDTVHGLKGEGTYLATKHLIELGHTKIAFAGGARESTVAEKRKYGYVKAMEEAGIKLNNDYCFEMGFSEDAGYKFGRYFVTLNPRPTAICCANDLIALGTISAFNEFNIKVPDDVSITGMDNIVFTNTSRPRLTTVDMNSDEIGINVMNLLLDRIEGRYTGSSREIIVNRKLIIRDSTREMRE